MKDIEEELKIFTRDILALANQKELPPIDAWLTLVHLWIELSKHPEFNSFCQKHPVLAAKMRELAFFIKEKTEKILEAKNAPV